MLINDNETVGIGQHRSVSGRHPAPHYNISILFQPLVLLTYSALSVRVFFFLNVLRASPRTQQRQHTVV